jgi:hypothetical protein
MMPHPLLNVRCALHIPIWENQLQVFSNQLMSQWYHRRKKSGENATQSITTLQRKDLKEANEASKEIVEQSFLPTKLLVLWLVGGSSIGHLGTFHG